MTYPMITTEATPEVVKGIILSAVSADSSGDFFNNPEPYLRWIDGVIPSLGKAELADEFPGDTVIGKDGVPHVVLKVTLADGTVKYYRQNGEWNSFDGYTWDGDFCEVAPREETRIEWDLVGR